MQFDVGCFRTGRMDLRLYPPTRHDRVARGVRRMRAHTEPSTRVLWWTMRGMQPVDDDELQFLRRVAKAHVGAFFLHHAVARRLCVGAVLFPTRSVRTVWRLHYRIWALCVFLAAYARRRPRHRYLARLI